jgi:hypothetical protein
MNEVQRERIKAINKELAPTAFELAWHAFQNTTIDVVADSDDETCKCLHNAIVAYLSATGDARAQGAPKLDNDTAVNCARFVRWALQEGPWQGGDLDGGGMQDKAESLGLIVSVPYDPEKHGAYNDCGCDAGDPWFEFSPGLNTVRTSSLTSTHQSEKAECIWPDCDQPSGHDFCHRHCLDNAGHPAHSSTDGGKP